MKIAGKIKSISCTVMSKNYRRTIVVHHHGLGDALMFSDLHGAFNDPLHVFISENNKEVFQKITRYDCHLIKINVELRYKSANRILRLALFFIKIIIMYPKAIIVPAANGNFIRVLNALLPLKFIGLPSSQEILSRKLKHRREYFNLESKGSVKNFDLQSDNDLRKILKAQQIPSKIIMAPFAGDPRKNLSCELIERLIKQALRIWPVEIEIIHGPGDLLDDDIKSLILSYTDLTIKKVNFSKFNIDPSYLYISADNGFSHLVDLLGAPLIVLYGPTNAHWTGACRSNNVLVQSSLDCSPCQGPSMFQHCNGTLPCLR